MRRRTCALADRDEQEVGPDELIAKGQALGKVASVAVATTTWSLPVATTLLPTPLWAVLGDGVLDPHDTGPAARLTQPLPERGPVDPEHGRDRFQPVAVGE